MNKILPLTQSAEGSSACRFIIVRGIAQFNLVLKQIGSSGKITFNVNWNNFKKCKKYFFTIKEILINPTFMYKNKKNCFFMSYSAWFNTRPSPAKKAITTYFNIADMSIFTHHQNQFTKKIYEPMYLFFCKNW